MIISASPKLFRICLATKKNFPPHFKKQERNKTFLGKKSVLLLLVLFTLTACWEKNSQPEGTPAVPTATPISLAGRFVLWHSWTGADAAALEEVLAMANQRYPELQIETSSIAYNDLAQRYAEAVQTGSGPDLVLMPNWWLGDLAAAGVITPIDEMVPSNLLEPYWPETVENLRRSNQLFGIPVYFEVISLFYNRQLVDDGMLPGTTAELLMLPQKDPSMGIGLYNSFYFLYWGIPAYGGQLMDTTGRITLDQNDGAANFLAWLSLVNQTSGSYVDTDYGMLVDRFKKGEFAFFVDGPWSIPELNAALGDNLGVMLLPAGAAGPARPWMSTEGFLFNPNISMEQRRMAVQVALYLTNVDNGTILAQKTRRLPANQWASMNGDPLLEGFRRQAGTAHAMPNASEMAEVWGYASDMLIKVLDGAADPASSIIETTALINEANQK